MNEGWKKEKLANVFSFHNGKKIKPDGKGEYIAFGSNGPIGNSEKTLFDSGIIIGRVGAYCGSVFMPKKPFWASDNTIVVRVKEGYDQNFMSCYLSLLNLNWYAGGSAQPLLTHGWLKPIKINLPPLPTQRKIASILSAYDDLIENNLKQIKLCCELADNKFNSLFIQLNDWQTIPLYEYADYLGRGVTPKYEDGTGFYGINQKANKGLTLNKQVFKEYEIGNWVPLEKYAYQGDVLINSLGEGTIGRVHYYVGEEGTYPVDQHMTIFRAKEKPFGLFIYQFFNSEFGQAHLHTLKKGGTNMTMLNVGDLRKIKLKVPNQAVINEFYKVIQPLYDLKSKLEVQNENIKEARDILLPRLMTGMIDVEQMNLEAQQPTTA